jgi:hypothetical protein
VTAVKTSNLTRVSSKSGKVQNRWNKTEKYEFHSWRNYERSKFGVCELPFIPHRLPSKFLSVLYATILIIILYGSCSSSKSPGLVSRSYQIFWVAVGLEWGPFSLVELNEELLERRSSGSSLGNKINSCVGTAALTMCDTPVYAKCGTKIHRPVALVRSIYFACGLKATELVLFFVSITNWLSHATVWHQCVEENILTKNVQNKNWLNATAYLCLPIFALLAR